MCNDPASPAAEPLHLAADPWAFWLILQSRFLKCSEPAIDGHKGEDKRRQVSFLAKRKETDSEWPKNETLEEALKSLGLKVKLSPIYGDFYHDSSTIATGSIFRDADTNTGSADHILPESALDVQVSALKKFKDNFARLKIARPVKPQLRDALAAISVPKGNAQDWKRERRGGAGVVVGFVDNGCAFAHPNFIKKDENGSYKSRVKRIWDQSWSWEDSEYRTPEASEHWTPEVDNFGYGYELEVGKYDLRTGQRDGKKVEGSAELTEDELYAKLGHRMIENVVMDGMYGPADFTHGTHIMDIAVGANGVAPDADIVFVQLPQSAIVENTDQASARHILDGVAYIFRGKHSGVA